ncbi:hypothetical protein CLAIMM_02427 [Cladophialophora immunda]|nr:hypothetical protein CLAIMM_02427 [Cladophialophora immunda]
MIWRALSFLGRNPLSEDPARLLLNPSGSPVESCSVFSNEPSPMYGVKILCGQAEVLDSLQWRGDAPQRWHVWPDGDASQPKPHTFGEYDLRLFSINDECNPAGSLVRHREISSRPDSDETYSLINQWINFCRSTHRTCPNTRENVLPSRIIDVEPADGSQEPHSLT